MPSDDPRRRRIYFVALAAALAIGIFLRLPVSLFVGPEAPLAGISGLRPNTTFTGLGFDEKLYRAYVGSVINKGLTQYPAIVDEYIEVQKRLTGSILPPMRFLFIGSAYFWHVLFGTEALAALHNVASLFSMLALIVATGFAWRLKGPECGLAVAAMMAVAPLQIHMSQHALVDGFFAFWALLVLWTLWENLRAPRKWTLLVPYTLALAFMVTTKENAAFVFSAVVVLMVTNRWVQWGVVTRELVACTFVGALLGFVVLVFLAGGLETLRTTYTLSVSKNFHLPYAIATGDGPWHRYLVDLLLAQPVVLLLAIGAVFRLDRTQKPELFLVLFIVSTYLIMCNLRYGMNLRYANMWDMPLRVLAFSQLVALASRFSRYRGGIVATAIAMICVVDLRQYVILAVHYPLYELVPEHLLRALKILKVPPPLD